MLWPIDSYPWNPVPTFWNGLYNVLLENTLWDKICNRFWVVGIWKVVSIPNLRSNSRNFVGFTFCGIFSSGLKINERVTPRFMGLIAIEICILFFFSETFTSQRNAQLILWCLICGTRQYTALFKRTEGLQVHPTYGLVILKLLPCRMKIIW